jgi:hypothetical protein
MPPRSSFGGEFWREPCKEFRSSFLLGRTSGCRAGPRSLGASGDAGARAGGLGGSFGNVAAFAVTALFGAALFTALRFRTTGCGGGRLPAGMLAFASGVGCVEDCGPGGDAGCGTVGSSASDVGAVSPWAAAVPRASSSRGYCLVGGGKAPSTGGEGSGRSVSERVMTSGLGGNELKRSGTVSGAVASAQTDTATEQTMSRLQRRGVLGRRAARSRRSLKSTEPIATGGQARSRTAVKAGGGSVSLSSCSAS